MPTPEEVLVLCDGVTDAELFKRIRRCHPVLRRIPEASIRTYEQARFRSTETPLRRAVQPLHIDDRPDLIFCFRDRPILVVEMTEHAYTGDNGLQRFARFAVAAENGLPFIYFGPLRRVRDDELDSMEEGTASARSLTSDLFEGMKRLNEIFGTPQLYVEWRTADNGMPLSLGTRPSDNDILGLYGELLTLIAGILFEADPARAGIIQHAQAETTRLAAIRNTRASDVRFLLPPKNAIALVKNAALLCDLLDGGAYFDKGKGDKLFAKFSLSQSSITSIQLPDGTMVLEGHPTFAEILPKVFAHRKFQNPAMIYYTGYKWRPDPHGGAAVNVDYRICRPNNERTPQARATALIIFYPRISCNPQSPLWQILRDAGPETPGLAKMFIDRYGPGLGTTKLEKCTHSENLFSLWGNASKQARLFRRCADIVVLNDGIILGHPIEEVFA